MSMDVKRRAASEKREGKTDLAGLCDELRPAPERLEKLALKLMSSGLSAEEYAGRHGANVLIYSIHRYQYRSAETNGWVRRLGAILSTPSLLEQYQAQYLTPEELAAIKNVDEEF